MDPRQILQEIDGSLTVAMQRGLGKNGLRFPVNPDELADEELVAICERFASIFEMINEAYRFAEALSIGDLQAQAKRNNIFAMPLKALQASLNHLTWQTNQVADGDLSQQVDFLGEFSDSFNRMINALQDKVVLEERLKTITDVLGEGVYLVDTSGILIFMNPEAEKELGYSFQELADQPIHQVIHKQHADGSAFHHQQSPLFKAIQFGREYKNDDAVFTCKSGRLMPVSISCRPVIAAGTPSGAVIAFRDITEQKKHQEALQLVNEVLEKQATTDALTGVYNRMKLNKVLQVELDRARRYKSSLSIILLDIDKFKGINDTFGHLEGDAVLTDLAEKISSKIRTTDVFARWGGEEFMVVAPGCDLEQAVLFAEKLRAAVAQHQFSISSPVTASFGVATFREDDNITSITNRADQALYNAKENGRNRVDAR